MDPLAFAARRRALAASPYVLLLALGAAPFLFSADAGAQGRVTFGGSADPTPTATTAAPSTAAPTEAAEAAPPAGSGSDKEWAERDRLLNETNTLTGASGLMRTIHAQTGAPGQFRLGFTTEWFSAGFLCSTSQDANFPCPNPRGTTPITGDTMNHIGATMTLGISIAKLGPGVLEGYASTSGYANSDNANRPALLQVLGDTSLGFKYGAPLSSVFWLAGYAEMWLINGTGAVGLDGGSTSAKFGLAGTADLRGNKSHTPFRMSLNAGYSLDNTGNVLTATETARGTPVTRIERFGLGVNRVDFFNLRAGAEVFLADEKVRPFIEYGINLPSNRQGYACKTNNPSLDNCLANSPIAPSTFTIGGRFFPWKHGFSLLAALDIGVSGTGSFIEEVSPTPPWTLFIGAGWAVDTVDRPPVRITKTVEKVVEVDKTPKQGRIKGFVHEKDKQEGVPNAIVAYKDKPEYTAMATGADGRFVSQKLPDGAYTFAITAEGFKPGECTTNVPKGAVDTTADCPLEALPRTGNVVGTVRDADSNAPVGNIAIKLVDDKHVEHSVTADGSGAYRLDKVPPGNVEISVEAEGYLALVQQGEVKVRQDNQIDLQLHAKPKRAQVTVSAKEINIKQQIQFANDSAVIKPESFGLLTEIADTIIRNPRIHKIEIQGHTDNSGPADYNKQLSQQRADAVKLWLTQHGITADRLVSVGYGLERPLVPNVTAGNKARNRRVQFIILEQDPATRQ